MSPYSFKRLQQKFTKQNLLLLVKRFVIVGIVAFLFFLLLNKIFPLHDKVEYTTVVADSEGTIINAFLTSDEKWRMKTELNEISPLLREAIIAKEDQYFYYHPGINPFAMARAFFKKPALSKTHVRSFHHYHAGGKSTRAEKADAPC